MLAVSGMLLASSAQAQSSSMHDTTYKHEFSTMLSGKQEVPPVNTPTSGSASLRVHEGEGKIDFDLKVIEGENITAAHLHCAPAGQNGPVAVGLFSTSAGVDIDGTLASGTIDESDLEEACEGAGIETFQHLIQAMREDRVYVNVHSTEYPNGVVRGQLSMENMDHEGNESSEYKVMVMKHICNNDIKTLADFEALEKGKDPVNALVSTVLACPTTGLPGDAAVAGTVASPRANFDFEVAGSDYPENLEDANFMPLKLCETDLNLDADGNGTIASSTCLDVSHYEFMDVVAEDGMITVEETDSPAGTSFGTVRFTPSELDQNNDKQALDDINVDEGKITLDMRDDKDGMVMLHVYNFPTENTDEEGENTLSKRIKMILNEFQRLQDDLATLLEELARR